MPGLVERLHFIIEGAGARLRDDAATDCIKRTIASWAIGIVPLAKVEKGQLRRRCANRPGPGNLTTPKDKVETLPVEANTGSAYPGIVFGLANQIGRASCRERVCQYV